MINESIYGNKESWDNNPECSFLKMTDFGENENSLYFGVTRGKLSPDVPIDKSIAFCGIGSECPLSNVQILTNNGNDAVFESTIERDVTNWCFYTTTERFVLYGDPNRISDEHSDWKDVITDTKNINRYINPITDFNIKNLVGCIYLQCYDSNGGGGFSTSLKEYLTEYVNSYPYVSSVSLYLYGGEVGNPFGRDPLYRASGTYGGVSVSTLDSFTVGSDELYRYASFQASSRFNYLPIYGSYETTMYSGEKWLIYGDKNLFEINRNDDYLTCYIHVTNANEFKELCLKGAAQYALYFTDDDDIARTGSFTDENMYIGVLDKNGITHGEYLKGTATAEAIQNEWDSIRDSEYDYNKKIDPNTYYKFTNIPLNGISSPDRFYFNPIVSRTTFRSAMISALHEVSEIAPPTSIDYGTIAHEEWQRKQKFMFQEPIECISGWRVVLLKPPTVASSKVNITIGWFQTENPNSMAYIKNNEFETLSLGSKLIYTKFGDSRDYEPYTKMTLYVPFCGTVELPMATFMGHTITLRLNVNYRTGEIEALIFNDEILWGSLVGTAAIELPLSGNKSMEYIQRKLQLDNEKSDIKFDGMKSVLGNLTGASISAFKGNIAGAAFQGASAALDFLHSSDLYGRVNYEIEHTPNKIASIQKGNTSISQMNVMYPFILIQRPTMIDGYSEEVFAKINGHATLQIKNLKELRGYTEAANPLLDGISCTETEKEMILNALQDGCIFDEIEE